MSHRFWLGCLLLLIGSAAQAEVLSYQRDIQPIFTAKCVACHACYDSPCQLNLGSGEGAERGANKLPVYNGVRSRPRPRLACFSTPKASRPGDARASIRCSTPRAVRRR